MQKTDIYNLGAKVEIKTSLNGENVVAYIYTKGKNYAQQIMQNKNKNISLTKKDKMKLAGIEVITSTREIQACCYAKALFEKIEAERKRGQKIYAKEVAERLNHDLKRHPVSYFLSEEVKDRKNNAAHHTIVGAKAFSRLKESTQDSTLEKLIETQTERV